MRQADPWVAFPHAARAVRAWLNLGASRKANSLKTCDYPLLLTIRLSHRLDIDQIISADQGPARCSSCPTAHECPRTRMGLPASAPRPATREPAPLSSICCILHPPKAISNALGLLQSASRSSDAFRLSIHIHIHCGRPEGALSELRGYLDRSSICNCQPLSGLSLSDTSYCT